MRALHIAFIAAVLAIPSVGYSQDNGPVGQGNGPVGGKVGPGLGLAPTQPGPSIGAHPYGPRPSVGRPAGYAGAVAPGQVVPQNVPVTPQPGGMGSAVIEGHRVLIDPNSNRVMRVFN